MHYRSKICNICNLQDVEDEYHFILICPAYYNIRQKFKKPFYNKKPNVHKLCQLSTSNKNSILKLCKYISEAFVMRKDFIMID